MTHEIRQSSCSHIQRCAGQLYLFQMGKHTAKNVHSGSPNSIQVANVVPDWWMARKAGYTYIKVLTYKWISIYLSVCQNVNNSIDNCSNLTHSRIKYDTRVKECLFEHFQACWQNVYYHLISETSQVSHLSWCNRFFKHTHVYAVSQEQCGNYGLPL